VANERLARADDEAARIYQTPGYRAPQGADAFWLTTARGVRLRVALWRCIAPRGTVIILTGRTEPLEKYFETIAALLERRFCVLIFDWRGQGASTRELGDPRKGHVASFTDYVDDFAAVLDEVEDDCPRPWVLLAHSMGGNVALLALHEWRNDFQAAVLSAPMIDIRLRGRRAVSAISRLVPPSLFVPNASSQDPAQEAFEGNPLTHDRQRFARNQALVRTHPSIALGGPTWGWLHAALKACDQCMAPGFLEAITTPTLIVSASAELIVDNTAQARAAERLANGEYLKIAGAKHEILMETDAVRAAFWSAFDAFVDRQLSPSP